MIAQSSLPTTDVMLFGAITLGLLAALRGNHVSFDKYFTQLVESNAKNVDKMLKQHEKVADGIVHSLGGVRSSVDDLGVKIERHGQRIRSLSRHVRGVDDDESDG
jgi:hypothetical protein